MDGSTKLILFALVILILFNLKDYYEKKNKFIYYMLWLFCGGIVSWVSYNLLKEILNYLIEKWI